MVQLDLLIPVLSVLLSVITYSPAQFPQFPPDLLANPAMLDMELVNVTVREGQAAVLPCHVTNMITEDVVSWLFGTKKISACDTIQPAYNEDGRFLIQRSDGDVNLRIEDVKLQDEGRYTCMLQTFPPQMKYVNLIVQVPATIDERSFPRKLEVIEGGMVNVICKVSGTGWLSVNWYHFTDNMENRVLYVRGETLTIPRIQRSKAGTYQCETQNLLGMDSQNLVVDVQYKPTGILDPPKTQVMPGEEAIIHCTVDGNPSPKLSWQRNGKKLVSSQKIDIEKYPDNETATISFLTIEQTHIEDAGDYVCVGVNKAGKYTGTASLHVIMPTTIPVPTTSISTREPETTPVRQTPANIGVTTNNHSKDSPRTGQSSIAASVTFSSIVLTLTALFSTTV